MREIQHYIGGKFFTSGSGHLESVDPANPDNKIGRMPIGGKAEVELASEEASSLFDDWRSRTGAARGALLFNWADAIVAREEEFALAIASEVGKPIMESRGEVQRCVAILRYFASEAVRPVGEVVPSLTPGALQYSIRVPLGTVGLITPWNFPMAIPVWKAAPALSAGNCVIWKPSELSPWCSQLLAEAAHEAGLVGMFQLVQGNGETGKDLLEDTRVAGISFTGSDRTGNVVATACAASNKKFQTEMGGKNVAIVLPDADLPKAANLVAGGAMRFAGQKCTATSRVVVDQAIQGRFIDELKRAIDQLPVGDPSQVATAIGPVISADSQRRIGEALKGAERLYSGECPQSGYFVAPTLVGGVTDDHDLAQIELFGPVLTVLEADSFDSAIRIANHTKFGLSASICTRDLTAALKYIDQIQAGMVRVNADTTGVDPHAPFGGFKGSSSGSREQGQVAKDFYTQIKTVQINP